MTITPVQPADMPTPGGHYSPGVRHGDTLYISGQLGITSARPDADAVSVADQVATALGNAERIALAAGANRADFVKCTVFVSDVAYWAETNTAYAAFFGTHRPARSIVPCGALHYGSKVEIEAVVAIPG
ncbi:RidA family protein [Acidisphaera sp. L21]|uniref:RidA family protein n=1 Tax=Acidisphaera sp. L21 TaxID=1641851 RepID=UPI001C208588|nr:RidA family protein [Acidisphaera sp. L21]